MRAPQRWFAAILLVAAQAQAAPREAPELGTLPTRSGAPETAAVESALNALAASCDGLGERLLWLECSESPCYAYVRTPTPEADWASLTCQEPASTTLHGVQLGSVTDPVQAAIFVLGTEGPPAQSIRFERMKTALDQVGRFARGG